MASVWVRRVVLTSGAVRHRVVYRLGGRGSARLYGGSFRTARDARVRRDAIVGMLARREVPDLRSLELTAPRAPTLAEAAKRWQASRVDVSEATATYHRSAINRAKPLLARRVDEITADDVAALVAALTAAGRAR